MPDFTPADLGYPVKKGPRPFENKRLSSAYQIKEPKKKIKSETAKELTEINKLAQYKNTTDMSRSISRLNKARRSLSTVETRKKVFDLVD